LAWLGLACICSSVGLFHTYGFSCFAFLTFCATRSYFFFVLFTAASHRQQHVVEQKTVWLLFLFLVVWISITTIIIIINIIIIGGQGPSVWELSLPQVGSGDGDVVASGTSLAPHGNSKVAAEIDIRDSLVAHAFSLLGVRNTDTSYNFNNFLGWERRRGKKKEKKGIELRHKIK